jgi:hypothetical protein
MAWKAYHSARLYKERTKRWHNHRIQQKEFKEGDKVLLFNSRVKLFDKGKLHSRWEGPFTIVNLSMHDAITIQDSDGNTFKVNGKWLKVFLEPSHDINQEINEINLISFDEFKYLQYVLALNNVTHIYFSFTIIHYVKIILCSCLI